MMPPTTVIASAPVPVAGEVPAAHTAPVTEVAARRKRASVEVAAAEAACTRTAETTIAAEAAVSGEPAAAEAATTTSTETAATTAAAAKPADARTAATLRPCLGDSAAQRQEQNRSRGYYELSDHCFRLLARFPSCTYSTNRKYQRSVPALLLRLNERRNWNGAD
jgi:hypothetical protein